MKKFYLLAVAAILAGSSAFAQENPEMQKFPQAERPERPSVEQRAEKKAEMMRKELALTDKQYKKVYKLVKKDLQYRDNLLEEQRGQRPEGGPGMMGGQGGPGMGGHGGPGMMGGQGGPGMGGQGGPGMGGQGGPGMGGRGMGGQGGPGMGGQAGPEGGRMMRAEIEVSDEYLEKQDAKLRKILTEEQYATWRAKHPADDRPMPLPELNVQEK